MADGNTGDVTLFGAMGVGLFFDQRRGELTRLSCGVLRPWRGIPEFNDEEVVCAFRDAVREVAAAMDALEGYVVLAMKEAK